MISLIFEEKQVVIMILLRIEMVERKKLVCVYVTQHLVMLPNEIALFLVNSGSFFFLVMIVHALLYLFSYNEQLISKVFNLPLQNQSNLHLQRLHHEQYQHRPGINYAINIISVTRIYHASILTNP